MAESARIALVVGATSGIGFSVAVGLFGKGYRVYGAGRSAATRVPVGVIPCPMDVRSEAAVHRAVQTVLDREGRIDVLVGSAGRMFLGAIEESTEEEEDAIWEVTYRGALRVLREVLPSMRQRRSGRIVHICSLLTTHAMPFASAYGAANSALLTTSEALRHEVAPLGIHVSSIIATDRQTGLFAKTTHASRRIEDYAEARAALERAVAHAPEAAAGPEAVSNRVLSILEAREPVHVYRVGAWAQFLVWLMAIMPYRMNERGFRRHMYLPPAKR